MTAQRHDSAEATDKVEVAAERAGASPGDADAAGPGRRRRLRVRRPGAGLAAVVTWLLCFPTALWFTHHVDLNPLSVRGVLMPISVGAIAGAMLLGLAWWRRSDILPGVAAGAYAAWVGLVIASAYVGTPYGDSGLRGDAARLAAYANRLTEHWLPVDAFVPSLPAEYPPLYPWLVARASGILDRPAWALLGDGETLLMSLSVLFGFLLWTRLTSPSVAFVLAVLPPLVFAQPRKSYEILTLAIVVPWALATFTDRPRTRGGLHWLPAGVIGGLIVSTYQGYLLFAGLGIVALIVTTWRASVDRRRYLLHLLGVAATAFLVSAWYVVPFVQGVLTLGGQRTNDSFVLPALRDPLGISVSQTLSPQAGLSLWAMLLLLQVVGLFGMAWYARSQWWARPVALMVASAFAYHVIWLALLVRTGHTSYMEYTTRFTGTVLAYAGVLTVATAAPRLATYLKVPPVRQVGVLATAVVVTLAAYGGWAYWMPTPHGFIERTRNSSSPAEDANLATYAHVERLPDGRYPRYRAPGIEIIWLPIEPIQRAVRSELGAHAKPVTLSYDERLFAFLRWPAYVAVDRGAANTFSRWDDRHAELQRIAAIKDPAAFAAASQRTAFGPIDVFLLRPRAKGWFWSADVAFSPAQFDPASFTIVRMPSIPVVLVIRKPADAASVRMQGFQPVAFGQIPGASGAARMWP